MNRIRTRILQGMVLMTTAAFPVVSVAQPDTTAGLKLPEGFTARVVAQGLGRTRHLVVTPQSDIYVRLARPVKGNGTLLLHEKDGKAEVIAAFGRFGGTGICLRNGYLYTSSNSEVFRYQLDANNRVVDTAAPERIVTGLVDRGQHETKSLALDGAGNLYVTIGAPSNSCQERDRQFGSRGIPGCPLLETAGGVWQFKTNKPDQSYHDGVRYATGLRNVVGLDWNVQANKLFVMQHGRDQLNSIFPDLYTVKQSAELPAECMYALDKGSNAGWPYTYYDQLQKKKVVAPEYGGNGKRDTAAFLDPVAAYPGHLAPNALLFYTGTQFPERYRNGAFIAFHGSWNRSPEPQAGYFVVFQPFRNGVPYGDWEVFADNFSGGPEKTAAGRADHRPCGLAMGPDGSLYVSDDAKGTLYKISYTRHNSRAAVPVEETKIRRAASGPNSGPARANNTVKKTTATSTNANAGGPGKKAVPAKPTATTAAKGNAAAGKTVYLQACATCHQPDGGGVQNMNPPLHKTSYVLGDKTRLAGIVLRGMSGKAINGETYSGVMPAFAHLTDKQIADVLTYVRSSFGNRASAVSTNDVKKGRGKK